VGGELATRYAGRNEHLQLVAAAASFVLLAPITAAIFLVTNPYIAFAILGVSEFASSLAQGPLFASFRTLVPSRMRAVAIDQLASLRSFASLCDQLLAEFRADHHTSSVSIRAHGVWYY
jgi:hypothetical protein